MLNLNLNIRNTRWQIELIQEDCLPDKSLTNLKNLNNSVENRVLDIILQTAGIFAVSSGNNTPKNNLAKTSATTGLRTFLV